MTILNKICVALLLIIILFIAIFVRVVPNYATKYQYEVVNIFDYNKYKKGYCLKEDRIIPKEELYKRAVGQYMQNAIIKQNGFKAARCKEFGDFCHNVQIEHYYVAQDFNESNWYEYLDAHYNESEQSFNFGKLEPINEVLQYLTIDVNSSTAGFIKPIVMVDYGDKGGRNISYVLYLKKSFLIKDKFRIKYAYMSDRTYNWRWLDYMGNYTDDDFYLGDYSIDNCGNINQDIWYEIKSNIDMIANR